LKYDTAILNAAALTYGICSNHPFHNRNKRTSLVAMLCHLDRNDLTFDENISHEELYDFMLKVASHGFAEKTVKDQSDVSDSEVSNMARWIRKRTRRVENGERLITFRELRHILQVHGFSLEDAHSNTIDVVKYEVERKWLGLSKKTRRVRVMRMSYPGEGITVGRGLLRDLRKRCGLSEKEGCDSKMFYAKVRPADYFVSSYRGTLRRLARV
jgi:death-on-curing protein